MTIHLLSDRGLSGGRQFTASFTHVRLSITIFIATVVTVLCNQQALAIEFAQIEAAWRNRQQCARTVELHWSERRTSTMSRNDGSGNHEITKNIPDMKMYMSDNKVRFEDVFKNPTPDTHANFIEAYKDAASRTLSISAPGDGPEPDGQICFDGARPKFAEAVLAWPPLLIYRGAADDLLDCALSDFQGATIDIGPNGDATLHCTSKRYSSGKVRWALTLRPTLDFAPIRLTGKMGEVEFIDVGIEIERGVDSMLYPTGWRVLLLTPGGGLMVSNKAAVTSCVVNKAIDETLFDLEFPIGTMVTDLRPVQSGGPTRDYLVTEDGQREVLRSELARGASRDELMRTATGEAGKLRAESDYRWLIALNVALIMGLVILLLLRRRNTSQITH